MLDAATFSRERRFVTLSPTWPCRTIIRGLKFSAWIKEAEEKGASPLQWAKANAIPSWADICAVKWSDIVICDMALRVESSSRISSHEDLYSSNYSTHFICLLHRFLGRTTKGNRLRWIVMSRKKVPWVCSAKMSNFTSWAPTLELCISKSVWQSYVNDSTWLLDIRALKNSQIKKKAEGGKRLATNTGATLIFWHPWNTTQKGTVHPQWT